MYIDFELSKIDITWHYDDKIPCWFYFKMGLNLVPANADLMSHLMHFWKKLHHCKIIYDCFTRCLHISFSCSSVSMFLDCFSCLIFLCRVKSLSSFRIYWCSVCIRHAQISSVCNNSISVSSLYLHLSKDFLTYSAQKKLRNIQLCHIYSSSTIATKDTN